MISKGETAIEEKEILGVKTINIEHKDDYRLIYAVRANSCGDFLIEDSISLVEFNVENIDNLVDSFLRVKEFHKNNKKDTQ